MRFSRKMAVFALFCVGQSGADAQLGSPAIVRETRLTHISPPHIQILCNVQVAYRMVPRDARRCLTCSMICPRMTKTLMILSPSSTPTSRRLFRKCAVRPPLTLTGKATEPYDDGRVQPGDDIHPPRKRDWHREARLRRDARCAPRKFCSSVSTTSNKAGTSPRSRFSTTWRFLMMMMSWSACD